MATAKAFRISGKRRRNAGVKAIGRFRDNLRKVGKVNDTDLSFYAYVAGLGVDEEIPCKDPSKTFTFHKQELYIVLGSLQNIDLNNPLITEVVAPKKRLALKGVWSNKAVNLFKAQKEANPAFRQPDITSVIYLEEGKMYKISGSHLIAKAGDILKFIGVRLECSRITRSDLIEKYGTQDMGWFQFVKHVRNQPLAISDQLEMLDHAGLYTSSIIPYHVGDRARYNDAMNSFVLSLGPRGSYFEDAESGYFFQLDINYEAVQFQVPASKEDKDAAATKVGKSGSDADAPKVLQMGLGINIAGVQGSTGESEEADEVQSFLLDVMIFPWDRVNFTGKEVRPGPLFNFGIVSRGVWKVVMPHYFHMMDFTLIGSTNWKRTATYAGELAAAEGGLDHYTADVDEDNPDNNRFGGGMSADEHKAKMAALGFEEEEDMEEEGGEGEGGEDDPGLGKDESPSFDFAYNIQTRNIVFDAKTFWTAHAIPITPGTAQKLYFNYLRYTKKIQTDEDYPLAFKPMPQKHANEVFRNTNIICATCGFEKAEALVDIDPETKVPKIPGVTGYYAAVPWRNLNEEYLDHIAGLTPEAGDVLLKTLYNWSLILPKDGGFPDLSGKRNKKLRHAKALYDLESSVPYFMDKKDVHAFVPALFVTWKDDPGLESDAYKEESDKLIGLMTGGSVVAAAEEEEGASEEEASGDEEGASPQKRQRQEDDDEEASE
jgi:hypothetical protein